MSGKVKKLGQEDIEYVDSEGNITGDKIFPSFKTFIDIYFYGVFDKIYEKQLKEDNEELPDKSKWYETERDF